MPDVVLSTNGAIEACEMFLQGIREGFATNDDGKVPLSKAIDVLQKAFESVEYQEKYGGDDPTILHD
jgi:hypothetical protein